MYGKSVSRLWEDFNQFTRLEVGNGETDLDSGQHSGQWDNSWPWKMICKTKALVKVACFGWIATRGACLTQKRDFLENVGSILKPSWYYMDDASESERFTGMLAATGDTISDKADSENYSVMHLMDSMSGDEQGFL
ncbi:hypothetical protein HAX54_046117 [Datura stramonium]|uniref:Uncharacterized protein n=1 Tax=Datura stramonium TaxID=4076 RepID=A0ABS8WIT0_DATST|nr:hypothetical protein [Datura stramonium]